MSATYNPYGSRVGAVATRRTVVSTALLTAAVVLLVLGLVPFLARFVVPPPLDYYGLPFPVLEPAVHAGDVVPFSVSRCTYEPFDNDGLIPYIVSRNLVNDRTGSKTILPQLATVGTANVCETSTTLAHAVPDSTPPGTYYFEGVAHVSGRWRTVDAYFRTDVFDVLPPDGASGPRFAPLFQVAAGGPLRLTCSQYGSQAEAQAVYRAQPEALPRLDGDRDGIACESRPPPYDAVPVQEARQ